MSGSDDGEQIIQFPADAIDRELVRAGVPLGNPCLACPLRRDCWQLALNLDAQLRQPTGEPLSDEQSTRVAHRVERIREAIALWQAGSSGPSRRSLRDVFAGWAPWISTTWHEYERCPQFAEILTDDERTMVLMLLRDVPRSE